MNQDQIKFARLHAALDDFEGLAIGGPTKITVEDGRVVFNVEPDVGELLLGNPTTRERVLLGEWYASEGQVNATIRLADYDICWYISARVGRKYGITQPSYTAAAVAAAVGGIDE